MPPRRKRGEKISVEELATLLSAVDILEPLSRKAILELARTVPYVHLERDQLLYTPENRNAILFLLLAGRMRLYELAGRKEFTLSVISPGTVFGEMSLSMERTQGTYAQALEPSTVGLMSRNTVKRLVATNPEVGIRTIELLGERLARYGSRLSDLAYRGVLARLAGQILRLSEDEGVVGTEGIEIPVRYTHWQLGTMIGANREAVTGAFGRLRKAGAVDLVNRRIYVRDRELLRRVAEGD